MKKTNNRQKAMLNLIIDRVLCFASVFFVTSGIVVSIAKAANLRLSLFVETCAFFILMLAGYMLQSLFCKLRRFERKEDVFSYEATVKFFSISQALPVLIIGGIAGIAVVPSVREYLKYLSWTYDGYYYDADSLIPYLVTAFIFLAVAAGSLAWFFPFERIATGRIAIACAVLLFVATVVSVNVGADGLFPVCIAGYASCWMFGTNRQALRKIQTNASLENTAATVPIYNATVTLVLIVFMLAATGLIYVLVSGLFTFGSLLIATILASGENDTSGIIDSEEISNSVNTAVYGTTKPQESPEYWFMILFIAMFFMGIFLFLVRKNRSVHDVFVRIKELLAAFIDWLFGPIRYFIEADTSENLLNYVDEEKKLKQDIRVSSFRKNAGHSKTWKDFLSEFKSKKTDEERYSFAYSQYIELMRGKYSAMRDSDTPRESELKLIDRTLSSDEKSEETEIRCEFEKTEFAGVMADKDTEKATKALLKRIKIILD